MLDNQRQVTKFYLSPQSAPRHFHIFQSSSRILNGSVKLSCKSLSTRNLSEDLVVPTWGKLGKVELWNFSLDPIGDQSSITFNSSCVLFQSTCRIEQCSILCSQVLEHQEYVYSLACLTMSQMNKFFSCH
jgi:hypothetical protein